MLLLLLLLLELSMMMVWEGLLTGFVALAAVSYHRFRRVRGGMRTSDGLFSLFRFVFDFVCAKK